MEIVYHFPLTLFYVTFYSPQQTYETTNSARMAVFGGCAAAPFMYYWYKFLDAKIPGVSSKVIIAKVIVDQAVAGFALLNIFYVCM